MSTILKVLFTSLLTVWLFPLTAVLAAPIIMPVSDLAVGMHGIAKTVVEGTKIEDFDVEILGVMKNQGPSGDLILVRTSGSVIDRTGGIAQGMSGSPVYIDGKLVGAIAYGWSLTDHKIGMVTPIGDMLKNLDIADPNVKITPTSPMDASGAPANLEPAATQLMVSGYTPEALSLLETKLEPFHLTPLAVGDAPAGTQYGSIEPGSSIGVQLVRGDVNVGALGTVTYVDGDKFVAFGHPFMQKGFVDFLASNAYIFTTVSSLDNSFKVGVTGELVGTVNQDRGSGISGQLKKYPYIIPFRVTVEDKDLHHTVESDYQVVRDEDLAPTLGATGVYNVIQKATDRVGGGTAKVSFEITGRGLPVEVIKRENMFYAPAKIGELSITEIFEALDMLIKNPFHPIDLFDVKVNVSLDSSRQTATVLAAAVANPSVKPGDSVNINVTLKPFRGDAIVSTIPYKVSETQLAGPLVLEVRGGGMVPLTQLLLKRQGLDPDLLHPDKKTHTLDTVVNDFVTRDHNNDIVVESLDNAGDAANTAAVPVPAAIPAPVPTQGTKTKLKVKTALTGSVDKSKAIDANKKDRSCLATGYIIDGDAQVALTVSK